MKLYNSSFFLLAALFLLQATAHAQTGDWPRVQSLRQGTTLIVETGVNPYGPATFDRCRLKAVDATTLTCTTLGWAGKRLVFPASRIDALYRVKQPWVKTAFTAGIVGIFVGGLISGNPPAIGIGVVGGLILFFVDMGEGIRAAWRSATGPPDPLPADEKHDLIYLRPVVPVAAPPSS